MTKTQLENVVRNIDTHCQPRLSAKVRAKGILSGASITPTLFGAEIDDISSPHRPGPVIARIDEDSVKAVASEDEIHEIVIVVGANYGQWGTSRGSVGGPVIEPTGMWANLAKIFAALPIPWTNPILVATNFFPYLTHSSWGSFGNSIAEMLLIEEVGFPDPYTHLAMLLNALEGTVAYLVFHGANNAVPVLGRRFVRQHLCGLHDLPQIIFCDNLARMPAVSNAVLL